MVRYQELEPGKTMLIFKFVSIIFTVICTGEVMAQNEQLKFSHLTRENGLPSNSINSIYQDSDGFMWFGTASGLCRYDGYSTKFYQFSPSDSNSISSNKITKVLESGLSGDLWVGTQEGLNFFNRKLQTFKHYQLPQSNNIVDIEYWADSINPIVTTHAGIYQYNSRSDKFISLAVELQGNIIQCAKAIDNRNLILGVVNKGVFLLSKAGELTQVLEESDKLEFTRLIYIDSDTTIWLGSDKGLLQLNRDYTIAKHYTKNNTQFNSNRAHEMIEVKPGEYYVMERDGGLHYFKKGIGSVKFYTINKFTDFSISSKGLKCMYVSSPQMLWLGTFNAGIDYADFTVKKFNHYYCDFSDQGLFNSNVRALYQTSDKTIWIGTKEGGGISAFNKEEGTFFNIPHEKGNINTPCDEYVFCFEEYNQRYLLMGTLRGGLCVYDRQEGTFTGYNNVINSQGNYSYIKVYSLANAGNGEVWVGTVTGLYLFNVETREFTLIPDISNVRAIEVISEDEVWFASRGNGVIRYSKTRGVIGTIKHLSSNPNTLADNFVTAIHKDKKTNYWFATDNGISVFDYDLGFIKNYNTTNGLRSNRVASIEEDKKGNIWASTGNGLAKINMQDSTVRVYDVEDGLQGNEFEYYTSLKTINDELLFGGRNGFNIFDPDEIEDSKYIPNVVITELQLFNEKVKPGVHGSPIKQHISYLKELNLKHNQNSIAFEFVALNYSSTQKVKYRYILENFDKKWRTTSLNRLASYTNLPPGDYTFRVEASNHDGYWGNNEVKLDIVIRTPFWKSWLFRIFVGALFVYLAYRLFMVRIKKLRNNQRVLEDKIRKGELVLEEKVQAVEKQKQELRQRDLEQRELRYVNEGRVLLGEIISDQHADLGGLCQSLITGIVEYTKAVQGMMYVIEDANTESEGLKIYGKYGVDKSRLTNRRIAIGEGYEGTCYKRKEVVEIVEVPENYVKVESGLGGRAPKNIIFIPIKQNEDINGVLEIGCFEKFEKFQVEFLVNIAASIYSAINTIQINEQIQYALEYSKSQTEELQANEEELRQNLEEVNATKEEMQRQVDNNKKLENQLNIKQKFYQSVLSEVNEFVCVKSLSGMVMELSKNAHPFYPAVPSNKIVRSPEKPFLPKESAKEIEEIEKKVIEKAKPILNRVIAIKGDSGGKKEFHVSWYPQLNMGNMVIGVYYIVHDTPASQK